MVKIKACIFDLDGVIVDTAKYHYLAWKRLANELGFDFTEGQNERLKGVSRMQSLEILLDIGKKFIPQEEMEKMAAKKNEWYVTYINQLKPEDVLPGVISFLDGLKEYGIKIGLGSASKNAPVILERLNLKGYFDAVIDGSEVINAKPDPEVFLKGALELGVYPRECVVFEDAQAGIDAAKNGNMLCVGIGLPENLSGADYLIQSFENMTCKTLMDKLEVE